MNKFETIFLHIGLHKTGSSAIQDICDKNRDILAVHDTFYPTGRWHGQLGSVFAHNKLGFVYNIHSRNLNLSEIEESDKLYINTLSQELSETNCRQVVISYEGFIDLNFSEICDLRDFLHRHSDNMKVIAYCRHPLSFAPSEISQRARMGLPTGKHDWANAPIPTFREYLEKFALAFGKERLTIADFARDRLYKSDVRLDFLNRVGIVQPEALGICLPNTKANEALSEEAVRIAEVLATRFTPPLPSNSFSLRFDAILSKIRGNPIFLSPAEKAVIMQAAEPHLRYLEENFGTTLSPPSPTETVSSSGDVCEMTIDSIADYVIQNELVRQGYRWLLGREPETHDVVSRHLRAADSDWDRLRQNIMRSPEFKKAAIAIGDSDGVGQVIPAELEDCTIPTSEVTICMMVFNEEEFISASISALSPHFQSFVILDMHSTDRTLDIIREVLGDRASIIEYDQNKLITEGYAAARNFCAGFATSPWALMVDADEVLVSGVSEAAIRIDLRNDDVALATVSIQNLERPVAGPPVRSVRSTVRPRRLFRPTQVRWEGYIHEALTLSPPSARYRPGVSALVFDHYTEFKDRDRIARKREMYYWMLLRAYEELPLRVGTNSYWYEEFVPKHLDEIKRGARSFDRRHNSIQEKIQTANDAAGESVVDMGCIRTLHTVSAREWIGQEARIAWCEWNHSYERSRSLRAIINDLTTMNWTRFITPGSVCIDIGAHSGDTSLPMGLFSFDRVGGRRGTVIAIEPNPEVFEVLRINMQLNSHIAEFKCVKAAITRENIAEVELTDHGNLNCNGGILDGRYSNALRQRLEAEAQVKYSARGVMLETLFTELDYVNPEQVGFMKTDCEGYDKEILRSAASFLKEVKPVLFVEWFAWFTPEDDADFFDVIDRINYVPLDPVTLKRVEREHRLPNLMCIHRSKL